MQSGEYITDRILPKAIKLACERQGIHCASFSDDWVLQLAKGHKTLWIFGYKFDNNAAAASHLAQDKVATYEVLNAAGIAAVPHVLVRSLPGEPIQKTHLEKSFLGGDVVIKPLSGTGGRGVGRYSDIKSALQFVRVSPEPAWAVSPYLEMVSETRVIVLAGSVLLAYEKQQPEIKNGLKFYNLSHGAVAVDIASRDIPASLREMALRSCRELGLQLAAVDVVTTASGEQLVLEVNDGFSMEYYARQSPAHKQRAYELYDHIITNTFA